MEPDGCPSLGTILVLPLALFKGEVSLGLFIFWFGIVCYLSVFIWRGDAGSALPLYLIGVV